MLGRRRREQEVIKVLSDGKTHYGLDIARAAGLYSGGLYPTLARLESRGIVHSDWEPEKKYGVNPKKRRRVYWLRTS